MLHFSSGKFIHHLSGDLSVSLAAAAQTAEVGGCNHKPEISQPSFLIQFLKVRGGKGRDGLWGWLGFFSFLVSLPIQNSFHYAQCYV